MREKCFLDYVLPSHGLSGGGTGVADDVTTMAVGEETGRPGQDGGSTSSRLRFSSGLPGWFGDR